MDSSSQSHGLLPGFSLYSPGLFAGEKTDFILIGISSSVPPLRIGRRTVMGKTVATISFAAGLIFQLPILIFFLARAGVVTAKGLKKYRKHALVGILVLSAIITPPDITSQIMVSLPVLALYELGIAIARKEEKRREKRFSS